MCSALVLIASCNKKETVIGAETTMTDTISTDTSAVTLKPTGPQPEWGKTIKPEMQVVIEKLGTLGGKPIESLDAKEARQQPTPTDAVMAVMRDNNISAPAAICDTLGKDIPVTGGKTHIRIYTPKTTKDKYPVVVYYHGGGFVIADIDVYNGGAQGLCEKSGAIVVSVEYPKGPEKKFPAAHTTAFDAYQWVVNNAASFKGDAKSIAVAGESAGGNLAINMSLMARDKKIQMPLFQILVYPVAGNDMNSESYVKYAMAKPLSKAMMKWFVKNYLSNEAQASDPKINVVNANLKGLPQTLIICAEIDPLQSEGKLLADKLNAAGVKTEYKQYDGVTHEFFGMAPLIPQATEAQQMAADQLKRVLSI